MREARRLQVVFLFLNLKQKQKQYMEKLKEFAQIDLGAHCVTPMVRLLLAAAEVRFKEA